MAKNVECQYFLAKNHSFYDKISCFFRNFQKLWAVNFEIGEILKANMHKIFFTFKRKRIKKIHLMNLKEIFNNPKNQ